MEVTLPDNIFSILKAKTQSQTVVKYYYFYYQYYYYYTIQFNVH